MNVDLFFRDLEAWATKQPHIEGVLLVGSYARDAARPDSDIDIVILSNQADDFFRDQRWLQTFGLVQKV